jgi:hypothetical protein
MVASHSFDVAFHNQIIERREHAGLYIPSYPVGMFVFGGYFAAFS